MKSRPTLPPLDELQRYTVEESIAYCASDRHQVDISPTDEGSNRGRAL